MRNRFFFIILATLVIEAVGINFVHVYFFKNQRLYLMDQQIEDTAAALLQSKEFVQAIGTSSHVQEAITDVLKGAKIGKAFIIRDNSGKIVFQSNNANLVGAFPPAQPEWVSIENDIQHLRVKNIKIPGPQNFTLQVALVLDKSFLEWEIIDRRVVGYISGLVIALFVVSTFLTMVLLTPLRQLITHLKEATAHLLNLKYVQPLPSQITRYTSGFWAKSDEFSSLVNTVQRLIDRINQNYRVTRSWTLQMAHELKTPLAVIRSETERQQRAKQIPDVYAKDMIAETQSTSDIISQFLDWAELENTQSHDNLHVMGAASTVKGIAERVDKISPGRIHLDLQSDFPVFANPIHLDQLISNLLTNALKFSPDDVHLSLGDHSLTIKDSGPGIPSDVLDRIGEPFNVGKGKVENTGNGLGLAWVSTVSKLYQWNFAIHSADQGTEAVIRFPQEEILG